MIYIIFAEVHTKSSEHRMFKFVLVKQTLHKQKPENICSDDIMLAQKWF